MKKNSSFILAFCILFFINDATCFAQEADDYAFQTHTTSSLDDMANSKTILASGLFQESSAIIPLGFEFWFMGVRYTDFSVNTNGVIQVGQNVISTAANTYTIAATPRIVPFASGSKTPISGDWKIASDGKIHYKTLGTSPNRIVVIEAKNLLINNTVKTETATFQVWLYETPPLDTSIPTNVNSGKIEFRYGAMRCGLDSLNVVRIGIGSDVGKNKFKAVDLAANPPTAKIADTEITNQLKKRDYSLFR